MRLLLVSVLLVAPLFALVPSASATCDTLVVQEGALHLADAQAGTSCSTYGVVYFCTARYFGGPPGVVITCVPFVGTADVKAILP